MPTYYKNLIVYVLVPLFIVLIVFGFLLLYAGRKSDATKDKKHRYKVDFWTSIIGIFFGAFLFSVAVAFAISFIESIHASHLENAYRFLLGVMYVFPIVPFIFLVFFIIHFIRIISHSADYLKEEEEDHEKRKEAL